MLSSSPIGPHSSFMYVPRSHSGPSIAFSTVEKALWIAVALTRNQSPLDVKTLSSLLKKDKTVNKKKTLARASAADPRKEKNFRLD